MGPSAVGCERPTKSSNGLTCRRFLTGRAPSRYARIGQCTTLFPLCVVTYSAKFQKFSDGTRVSIRIPRHSVRDDVIPVGFSRVPTSSAVSTEAPDGWRAKAGNLHAVTEQPPARLLCSQDHKWHLDARSSPDIRRDRVTSGLSFVNRTKHFVTEAVRVAVRSSSCL